jgi:hypothetical protein
MVSDVEAATSREKATVDGEDAINAYKVSIRYDRSKLGKDVEVVARDFGSSVDYMALRLPFPTPLSVVVRDCGESNASFRPPSTVEICYELVKTLIDNLIQLYPPERAEARGTVLHYATTYILGHELGHAYIALAHLQVPGNEEDVVDQLSAYITETLGGPLRGSAAVGAFAFFHPTAESSAIDDAWDEHAPDRRRITALACLSYGANPIGLDDYLPAIGNAIGSLDGIERRAARCSSEWTRIAGFWKKHIRSLDSNTSFRWIGPGSGLKPTTADSQDLPD